MQFYCYWLGVARGAFLRPDLPRLIQAEDGLEGDIATLKRKFRMRI